MPEMDRLDPDTRKPLLPRLDPSTRKPLKTPPMRRCVIDLAEGKTLELEAAKVTVSRNGLQALDSDGNLVGAVCSDAWRSWRFESAE